MGQIEFIGRPTGEGPGGAWQFLQLPAEVTEALGTKGRAPVVLMVGGKTFRVSAFPDGRGGHQINFNKQMQAAAGAGAGASIPVSVALDTKPRTVALPKDFKAALAKNGKARETFEALAPSHKKAYVDWIEEAKRPETREKRVREAVARLAKGQKFW